MAHWIGDKVTLKAGPLTGHDQGGPAVGNNDIEAHSEHHRPEYKESYITEYDDIQFTGSRAVMSTPSSSMRGLSMNIECALMESAGILSSMTT